MDVDVKPVESESIESEVQVVKPGEGEVRDEEEPVEGEVKSEEKKPTESEVKPEEKKPTESNATVDEKPTESEVKPDEKKPTEKGKPVALSQPVTHPTYDLPSVPTIDHSRHEEEESEEESIAELE